MTSHSGCEKTNKKKNYIETKTHVMKTNTTNAKEQLNSYVHLSFTVYAIRVD